VHDAIDWSKKFEFLDKELLAVIREAATGTLFVDKLVKVWLLNGREQWILLHLEVQHQRDPGFELRLFRYNTRLRERYDRQVVTLAILADADAGWRPSHYEDGLLGCSTRFDFPICKLLDFRKEELEQNPSPAALLVLANRAVHETRSDADARLSWKVELTRRLYERGYNREEIIDLVAVMDWLLALPQEKEELYRREIEEIELEKDMRYVTSMERLAKKEGFEEGVQKGVEEGMEKGMKRGREEGMEKGMEKALRESLLDVVDARFGAVPAAVRERIQNMEDLSQLQKLLKLALRCASPGELLQGSDRPHNP
jgi:predicted transposase YdaD